MPTAQQRHDTHADALLDARLLRSRHLLLEAAADLADALEVFSDMVWSDTRLPGDLREELKGVYHTMVVASLRKAGRLSKPNLCLFCFKPLPEPATFCGDECRAAYPLHQS